MGLMRTLALTDIIIRGHILVPLWWSREHRRAARCKVLTSAIPRYFKRYLPAAAAIPERKGIQSLHVLRNRIIAAFPSRAKIQNRLSAVIQYTVSGGIILIARPDKNVGQSSAACKKVCSDLHDTCRNGDSRDFLTVPEAAVQQSAAVENL